MRLHPFALVLLLLVAAGAEAQTTTQTTPNTNNPAAGPNIPTMQNTPSNTTTATTTTTTTPRTKTPSNNKASGPKSPAAGGGRTDFALFDDTDATAPEAGVECGATLGSSKNSAGFTFFVTVSNWSDALKVLRVVYADGEEVARYQIPAHTSFSFTQAGGGTPGVDDLITIVAEGSLPSGLAGSMSISVPAAAKPHPTLGEDFCTTVQTAPSTP